MPIVKVYSRDSKEEKDQSDQRLASSSRDSESASRSDRAKNYSKDSGRESSKSERRQTDRNRDREKGSRRSRSRSPKEKDRRAKERGEKDRDQRKRRIALDIGEIVNTPDRVFFLYLGILKIIFSNLVKTERKIR